MKTRTALMLILSSFLSLSAFANDVMTCGITRFEGVGPNTEVTHKTLKMIWGESVSIGEGEKITMRPEEIREPNEYIELTRDGVVIDATKRGYVPSTASSFTGYFADFDTSAVTRVNVICAIDKPTRSQ